jgi:hypothetical protein
VQPQFDEGLRIDPEVGEAHRRVEGRLRIPADMPGMELFTKQIRHMTSDELAMLHGTIRSMFLALMSTEERASNHAGSDWPTVFWRANFRLFPCELPEPTDVESTVSDDDLDTLRRHFMERVASVVSDLEQRLKGVDPDLYDPDRYEVAVGLTTRIVRIAQSVAAEPSLW